MEKKILLHCPQSTLPFEMNTEMPRFGQNYGPGWIGWTNTIHDPISGLIDYFERFDGNGFPFVSHTFVIESADTCIEALAGQGVVRSDLHKYFDDPRIRIYVRSPKAMSREIAVRIVDAAKTKLGLPYDRGLIISEMLADTMLGRAVNKLLSDWPHRLVAALLGDKTDYICSELVAYALSCQTQYDMQGVLLRDLDTIDPMELFVDQKIFDPFINDLSKINENTIPDP